MYIKRGEKRQLFKQSRKYIEEQIKNLVFQNKDFSFHPTKDKRFLQEKLSSQEITDLEAEEFMMRFFGLYVQKSKLVKWLKIVVLIAVVFFLYFNWDKAQLFLQQFVENVPFVNKTVGYVVTALNERALIGIFLLSFFVNLFFISFPDEVYFVTYLVAGHDPFILIPVIATGGLLGLTVDYVIGRVAGTALLRALMKQKYYKFKFASDKWGGIILILGNLIPSPVQWFAVALGAFNYGYVKFIFFSAVGKLAKYIGLVFGFNYYTGTLNPLINESFRPAISDFKQCLNQTNTTLPFLQ